MPPTSQLLDALRIEFFNHHWMLAVPGIVDHMHALGHLVSAWTVDEEDEMTMLIERGVDALTNDRTGALVKLLARTSPTHAGPTGQEPIS